MLYYYTNVETMRFILQGANIYATNLAYMNDAEEYANGVRELRDIFNERKEKELITKEMLLEVLENEITSYSISFSEARDLLSQWSMYAGESGVSLKMSFTGTEKYQAYPDRGDELKTDKHEESEEREESEKREEVPDTVKTQKVYYCTKAAMEEEEYKKIESEIWGETGAKIEDIDDEYPRLWKQMAPFVKRVEFKAEAEHRLVFNVAEWGKAFRIDYRNSQNVLKPYLDIECVGGWPIHEVVVGPGFNQDVVFRSILHFLNHVRLKVPKLDGLQYCERCEEYLRLCGDIPEEAEKIWCEYRHYFDDNAVDHYSIFTGMRRDMIKEIKADEDFREQLRRRELTRGGIILSRSRIPYIF